MIILSKKVRKYTIHVHYFLLLKNDFRHSLAATHVTFYLSVSRYSAYSSVSMDQILMWLGKSVGSNIGIRHRPPQKKYKNLKLILYFRSQQQFSNLPLNHINKFDDDNGGYSFAKRDV